MGSIKLTFSIPEYLFNRVRDLEIKSKNSNRSQVLQELIDLGIQSKNNNSQNNAPAAATNNGVFTIMSHDYMGFSDSLIGVF